MVLDRSKFKDPNYKGEDFAMNESAQDGPVKERRCTDILFYLVFLIFIGGMLGGSIYGYIYGSPSKLLAPLDSDGNICGYDAGYENYPYMYIWDIKYAVQSIDNVFDSAVCVKACPNENKQGTFKIDCKKTTYLTNRTKECKDLPYEYDSATYIINYCIPDGDDLSADITAGMSIILSAISSDSLGHYIADIGTAAKAIAICTFVALFLAIFYMFTLRYFAKIVAWISILLILISLIGTGVFCLIYSFDYPSEDSSGTYLKIAAGVCWVLALFYILALLCLWKSLQISLAVLEAASDFVGSNLRIVLVPVVFFIINVIIFCCWIVAVLTIFSVGNIDNGPAGTQYKVVKWSSTTRYLMYFMVFGILWILSFLIACAQFIIICACSTWYFSHGSDTKGNARISSGVWWIFRYHMGSLAIGSLIVAIIWAIKIIFEFISKKIKMAGGELSVVVRCLVCCCRCCLDCFDRFIQYINRNAYIQIALTSNNFCTSAMNGFILILKHAAKFTLLSGIGNIFIVLGKMTIASVTTLIGFIIMENWAEIEEALDSPGFPLLVIFMIAYVIGAIFVSVFSTSANTILQCFLVDTDISETQGRHGALHRPPSLESFIYIAKKDVSGTQIQ